MQSSIWSAVIFFAALAQVCGQSLSWSWSNPQPHGNDIVGMAWNGTLGVQVCDLGQVYTSPDLTDWFPQNSRLTNDLQAVTFFGKRIIVVGANGAMAYSDDGVNFTNCSVNSSGNWLVSVAASSNRVVAVGDNGVIYTSTNGATWASVGPPPDLGDSWLTSVAYGNGVFVTTGDTGGAGGSSYVATSVNGTNWTYQAGGWTGTNGNLEAVAWVNSSGSPTNFPYTGFWAASDAGDAFYSTNNGVAWKQFSFAINPSTNVLYAVAADATTALLAGDSEVRLGSLVNKNIGWPEQTGPALSQVPPWTYFAALSVTNGVYELAGYDGMEVESYLTNNGSLFGYAWTNAFCPRDWLFQVTVTNGLYVAVGDDACIMTSSDGADWTVEAVMFTNSISLSNTVFLCVGGTSNLLVAAGSSGSLAVSPNLLFPVVQTNQLGQPFTNEVSSLGVYWVSLPAAAGTTNDLAGVCTFSNKFFLAGGNGTVLCSANGTNWSKQTSGTTNYLSGLATATNGLLVATGNEGTIITSPNGTNWTAATSGTTNWLYRLRCLNGRLLAMGENGILLISSNATAWSKVASGVTNWLNDAVMVSNTCYVVGNQGVVLASTNLINWTNVGTITTKSLDGVASQNGQLVAVGFEGSILRSQVEPVLTPVSFISYSQADGYNVFSVDGVVDELFTLDSSSNLVNWVTGPELNIIYSDGSLIFYENLPNRLPADQYYRCTPVP